MWVESVKYQVEKRDPEGAALKFVIYIVKTIDRNNATKVLEHTKRTVSLIELLIPKLES